MQEVKRRLKLKDQALEAVKGELERVKETKTTEKVIEKEIIPDDYQATQDLNKQLLGKNKDLSDELDSVKRSLRLKEASYEMLEQETSEALALKESIEHLRADKEKLENSVTNIFTLSNLVSEFEDFFDELTEKNLAGKPFGVVGSGDREYGEFFCKSAHDFVGAFEKAGAKKVAETVEIENNAEEEDIEMLKTFVKSVATTLSDSVA